MNLSRQHTVASASQSASRKGRISLDHIWIISVLALIWLFISVLPLPPNDLWWHMAAGRIMAAQGKLITTNLWAYSLPATAPYVYQSWLSELVMYWLWRVGDVPLLTLGRTLAIALSYGVLAWHAWRRARNGIVVALVLFLAALIGWNNWTLRPQTLALVPGAIFVAALGEYLDGRARARSLALLPLAMLVWVNSHGSFMLGVGWLGCAWLGSVLALPDNADRAQALRRLRDLTVAGAATMLAVLANPLGLGIFGYVRGMLSNSALQQWFVEWQPPRNDLGRDFTGFWFYIMLFALVVLLARGPRRPSAIELLWFCGLAWLTISGVRYAIWFGLLLMPLLAERLAALLPRRSVAPAPVPFVAGLGLLLAGALIAVLPWFAPGRYLGPDAERLFASSGPQRMLLSDTTPIAATEWLAQHPQDGRFWTDMTYSSYTIWQLPEKQVFADLRVELFPEPVWNDYFDIAHGDQHSLELLDHWKITHLLLSRDWEKALAVRLGQTAGWCQLYQDSESVIFARCE